MPAIHKRWIVVEEVRHLFAHPRPVDVRERGKWPIFERAMLVAVDLFDGTATFRRTEHHDPRTHPHGWHTTVTTRTYSLDDIHWTPYVSPPRS